MPDYITNPFSHFISGNRTAEFKYDPGPNPTLWHVRLPERGVVRLNILMWAQSEPHVYEIMSGAALFQKNCAEAYRKSEGYQGHFLSGVHEARDAKWDLVSEAVHNHSLVIQPAPTDQVFKVAWASNDTI